MTTLIAKILNKMHTETKETITPPEALTKVSHTIAQAKTPTGIEGSWTYQYQS